MGTGRSMGNSHDLEEKRCHWQKIVEAEERLFGERGFSESLVPRVTQQLLSHSHSE